MPCIWCKQDIIEKSIEHGIPEALGCPPDMVLDDVACRRCNNGLGVIDQALVRQFEHITVMLGVPRKGGRPPSIDSWRSVATEQGPDGPHLHINAGPGVVEAAGKKLYPANRSNGITDVRMETETGKLSYSQQFGNDPRFVPSLYKIGLNLVARHFGPNEAVSEKYDHVRKFVLGQDDSPHLQVMISVEGNEVSRRSSTSGPITKPGRAWPMFNVQILGIWFLLDLDPKQNGLNDIRAASTVHGAATYVFPPSVGPNR